MSKDKIVIANWKMNLSLDETSKLIDEYINIFNKEEDFNRGNVVVCPNFLSLREAAEKFKDTILKTGSQNVFWENKGAYTSSVSPTMIKEVGCEYALISHSECRKYLIENYAMAHRKVKSVLNLNGLTPIVCIGESWEERKTDKRDFVLVDQLQEALSGVSVMRNQEVIVAYEPIWAIGSGNAIEPQEAAYAHKIIRLALNNMFGVEVVSNNFKIIYGGSLTSENAPEFMKLDNIDGAIIGGASLKIEEFSKIAKIILN